MDLSFTIKEGAGLHGLRERTGDDIIVRLDRNGFVAGATANFIELGYDLEELLLKPHLTDLADADFARDLGAFFQRVLNGAKDADWFEFPLRMCAPDERGAADEMCEGHRSGKAVRNRWVALSLTALESETGETPGAVGILRSVDRLRALEGEIYSRALIDPLTGLANRHAFCASLRRELASGNPGMMALLEVDRLRALFMQYGQRTADEIIWGFAKFLEAMALPGCELAQFDAERFCVILPGASPQEARSWAADLLETFETLTLTTSPRVPKLRASAGLAMIEDTVDATLRQAELGLVMARASGGMRVAEAMRPSIEPGPVARPAR